MSIKKAEKALINLEDISVIEDLLKGNYSTFDISNKDQFGDSYSDMIKDLSKM